ncbi:MAG: hypothetical protein BroJett021_33900 [Chloroflexota bacterium]|nr:MAG: hypothetical protein BroJett021_33900 [Chloroflexota bacterium]
MNVLVTPEGDGALFEDLAPLSPKKRARRLRHLAMTGLYAEAFLGKPKDIIRAGQRVQQSQESPPGATGAVTPDEKPQADKPSAKGSRKPAEGEKSRTGLEKVDTGIM